MRTEYKGYTIDKYTRCDWMIHDENGNPIFTKEGRVPRTKREAINTIEELTREQEA